MSARALSTPMKRALKWLAENPGEWRSISCAPGLSLPSFYGLLRRGLAVQADDIWTFRLTPAGIQAAKELGSV